jgi:hypothetical protein
VLHTYAFYWVIAGIALYAVATRGLFRATNNWRVSLIELASVLIENPEFPVENKEAIIRALDDVHSARAAWRLTLRLIRNLTLYIFFGKRPAPNSSWTNLPRGLQTVCDMFVARWAVATVSNSVLASFVFVMVVIVAAAFTTIQPITQFLRRDKADGPAGHAAHA